MKKNVRCTLVRSIQNCYKAICQGTKPLKITINSNLSAPENPESSWPNKFLFPSYSCYVQMTEVLGKEVIERRKGTVSFYWPPCPTFQNSLI